MPFAFSGGVFFVFNFVTVILTSGEEPTFVFNSKLAKADAASPNIEEEAFQGAKNIIVRWFKKMFTNLDFTK